jgi:DNA-binding response OmpR family regulator
LDVGSQSVTFEGRSLTLTGYEFALLRVLLERRGRVLSREQLLELAKGSVDDSFDRSIDVRISRLRQKLRDHAPDAAVLIRTVRGAGYMLVVGGEP